MNLKNINMELDIYSIVEYYNKPSEEIEIFKGNFLSIFFQKYSIKIENMEYSMHKLDKSCIFPSIFDSMLFSMYGNISTDNKYRIDFEMLDDFLSCLEENWRIIRESNEFLSILDRNPNIKYRIQFNRIIEEFKHEFVLLKKHSKLIKNVLEERFQTGFFTFWVNSRIDPVYLQFVNLNLKAKQIREGI